MSLIAALGMAAGSVGALGAEMAARHKPPVADSDAAAADSCGQRSAQRLVGTLITPQKRTALVRVIGHDRIRVIRPGAIITHDRRDDRLNLIVDDRGTLLAARCG